MLPRGKLELLIIYLRLSLVLFMTYHEAQPAPPAPISKSGGAWAPSFLSAYALAACMHTLCTWNVNVLDGCGNYWELDVGGSCGHCISANRLPMRTANSHWPRNISWGVAEWVAICILLYWYEPWGWLESKDRLIPIVLCKWPSEGGQHINNCQKSQTNQWALAIACFT